MKKYNVLIYPCSADNAIELYDSLKYSLHLKLFGANSKDGIADILFENDVINLPNITEKSFIPSLNQVIDDFSIDFIFPTHDDVIFYLSKCTDLISAIVIGGNEYINKICRYKSNTYSLFSHQDFCPTIFNSIEDVGSFPVFSKPDKGHGSIGVELIENYKDLKNVSFKENVISEYLPGDEYTVDCFSDCNNILRYAFPRRRDEVRNGVSIKNSEPSSHIVNKAFEIGKKINEVLSFKGLWFFQLKEDNKGELKLLEISSRIATTMAFSRFKGVNLPLLTLFAYLKIEVDVNIINSNVTLFRFSTTKALYAFNYKNVYIDFDDTLIVRESICLDAIAFLYQCVNSKIKIFLITKHQFDIFETLKKYKIPSILFDEIILLKMEDSKYEMISEPNSIFIDNHYKERNEVWKNKRIPVFDVDGIKSLIKN